MKWNRFTQWKSKKSKSCTKTISASTDQLPLRPRLHKPRPVPGCAQKPQAHSAFVWPLPLLDRISPHCSSCKGGSSSWCTCHFASGSTWGFLPPKPAPPWGQQGPGHYNDISWSHSYCSVSFCPLPRLTQQSHVGFFCSVTQTMLSLTVWDSCHLHTFPFASILSDSLSLHFHIKNPKLTSQQQPEFLQTLWHLTSVIAGTFLASWVISSRFCVFVLMVIPAHWGIPLPFWSINS